MRKEKAEDLASVSEQQIESIQFMLTKSSTENQGRSFWIGVAVSFPIGVFASVIAHFVISILDKT